jgi:hypothetical protein
MPSFWQIWETCLFYSQSIETCPQEPLKERERERKGFSTQNLKEVLKSEGLALLIR